MPANNAPIIGEIEPLDMPLIGEVEEIGGSPTFFEGVKAGLTAQPGQGVGHFIGAAAPATIGGMVGGPIGAAGGEAIRQAAGAVVNPEATAEKSPLEIGAQVAGAGYGQKLGEVAGPYAGKVLGKLGEGVATITDWLSDKIGKSFLKASAKLSAYGHSPVKAIQDEGIVATSWDDMLSKVRAKKHDIGNEMDDLLARAEKDTLTNVDDVVKPIDDAIEEANKMPSENKGLIERLNGLKEDTLNLLHKGDKTGQVLSSERANAIKRTLYRVTKFSGNPSDDAVMNKTKQSVARNIAKKIEGVTPEIRPLNDRYGNLAALESAVENRAAVAERADILGLPEYIGGSLAVTGHFGPGAAAVIGGRVLKTPMGGTAAMKGLGAVGGAAKQAGKMAGATAPKLAGGLIPAGAEEIKAAHKRNEITREEALLRLRELGME